MQTYYSKATTLSERKEELLAAFALCEEIVTSTMGPRGRNVFIHGDTAPIFSKDGITALRYCSWADPLQKSVSELLIDAANRTLKDEGDGTTTTVLLASRLMHEILPHIKPGVDTHSIVQGMEYAKSQIVKILQDMAVGVDSEKTLIDVCTISANNDKVLGEMIGKLAYHVGQYGTIIAQPSTSVKTFTKTIDGWLVDSPDVPISIRPDFIEDAATRTTTLENPLIVISDLKISNWETIAQIVGYWDENFRKGKDKPRPLVFIVEDMEGAPLSTIIANCKAGRPVYVLKAPYFMENRSAILEDMRIVTQAKHVFSNLTGASIKNWKGEADCGTCKRLTFGMHRLIIEPNETAQPAILKRKKDLLEASRKDDISELQKTFYEMRVARLGGGIGYIYVGGQTQVEQDNLFMVIDDAQRAAFSAWKGGVVVGAGVSFIKSEALYLYTDTYKLGEGKDFIMNNDGARAIISILKYPMRRIFELAGRNKETLQHIYHVFSSSVDMDKRKNTCAVIGANTATDLDYELKDGIKEGIIEPVRVPIAALENAVSIVKLFVQSNYLIELQSTQKRNG